MNNKNLINVNCLQFVVWCYILFTCLNDNITNAEVPPGLSYSNVNNNKNTYGNEGKGSERPNLHTKRDISQINDNENNNKTINHSKKHGGSFHVAKWNYDYVSAPFLFTTFVVLICVLKILYHHIKPLAASLPESCLLILLGVLLGLLFMIEHADKTLNFLKYDSRSFFLFLLPPIILEAAYSLRDRAFVENVGTILLFAVVGTIFNIFIVGPLLFLAWYCGGTENGLTLTLLECLIFSSLISAVDPVAVLAIFQEVGVNKMLYFMVFGESLFNDAVTVVVYNMLVAFITIDKIGVSEVLLGLAAFMCVTLGGMAIGIALGFLTGFITKFTSHVRVVEPVVFFALSYLSYLAAEMFHFSGIISIICCGILQGYYAMENISSKSYISIVYFSKVASSVMESLIFIILGVMMVNQVQAWSRWSTAFTLWSLFFCICSRFLVVFGINFLINLFLKGIRRVSYEEQFIMAYGGLRGAISFSLVFMLDENLSPAKWTLLSTTYVVIIFTVFLQGISIKPLVRLMRIKLDVQDSTIYKEINRAMIGNMLAGVEEIIGHKGTHYWTALFKHVSQTMVRPAVQKNPHKKSSNLLTVFQEQSIQRQLSTSASQSDVPKLAALWSQLEMMDDTAMSGSISDIILQAQDDYLHESWKKECQAERKPSMRKKRPPALSLDSPRELLMFRDMLQSPAHKTVHYVYDKDLASPSRQMFTDSMLHINRQRLKQASMKRRHPGGSAASSQFRGTKYLNVPPLLPGGGGDISPIQESTVEEENEHLLGRDDEPPPPKFHLESDD